MFSQLLFVRLKAAENALRDGRLDEAYRLATAPDIREHRRGANVLAGLTEKFIERARVHFRADRFAEALHDLIKAEAGGVRGAEVAELRKNVQIVAEEARRVEQTKRERLEAVRQRVEAGSLKAGQMLLAAVPPGDLDAQRIEREIERRRESVEDMVAQVERLLRDGQTGAAAGRLAQARAIDRRDDRIARLEAVICARVYDDVREAMADGRVLRSAEALAELGELGRGTPARSEWEAVLDAIRVAAAALTDRRIDDARQQALRLQHLLPDVGWIKKAVEQLKQADDVLTDLAACPLATDISSAARAAALAETRRINRPMRPARYEVARDAASREVHGRDVQSRDPGRARPAAARVPDDRKGAVSRPEIVTPGSLPSRLLILVDGGGSFLLLRSGSISVGRAASDDPADVPLISDLAERHAEITRVEDDYFLASSRDVEIGGRLARHQLLRDGDRIVFGRQAKLTFRLPNRKSATAVLDLSDTSRMPNDVRRVVMFNGNATLGSGSSAHMPCKTAERTLVLFERAGSLWIRPQGIPSVQTEARPVAIGMSVEMAGVSLVVQPWSVRSGSRIV